ncbi:PadR family transcriptional regulator [Leptospira bourretii]|uniref:PadR family transcriptional regulator n=1 Tax=Leptospira bourretii TaxID=2484962 RepID=A0A4R9IRJ7_9LEPT|nr:PadR family transcriptional regulator [Leptospira bourretii]TGK85673.1 PadR family transcriptional regulator [Leptospira bourretii]TGK94569.1 PadR family transcriptional regulator [Leptospira bourretii]TGL24926.1 PadR family transcriptional regulator [Leptospira bourretii]TGL33438.1 PadR family transcriptional regulator [Leptospira bourretii]
MKRESKTQYALLGILSQCEMNGYEIRKYIESTISFFWSESFGQIYPTLAKLEEEGLIREWEKTDNNGKKKKVYKITRPGLEAFRRWMDESPIQTNKRNELLFKVFFGRHMNPKLLTQQLEEEVRKQKEDLKLLKNFQKELDTDWEKHPDLEYWSLTLEYAEKQTKLNLDWIDKVKSKIKS